MSTAFHLAQLNVARLREPIDSPLVADFVAALPSINALADGSPGFVWRPQTEGGDATSIHAFEDPLIIVNLTVWQSVDALDDFAFRSSHRDVMRRRREWFERMADAYVVLWWVPAGTIPTVAEARRRLDLLRRDGPSVEAFTCRAPFPALTAARADSCEYVEQTWPGSGMLRDVFKNATSNMCCRWRPRRAEDGV